MTKDYTALAKGRTLNDFMDEFDSDTYFFVYAMIRNQPRLIAMNENSKIRIILCAAILESAVIGAKLVDGKFDVMIDLEKEGKLNG